MMSTPLVFHRWFSTEACDVVTDYARANEALFGLGSLGTGYEKIDLHKLPAIPPELAPAVQNCLAALGAERGSEVAHYLLRMREGTILPLHQDTSPGKDHLRFNVLVAAASIGGDFMYSDEDGEQSVVMERGDGLLFRPDLTPHGVSKIETGWRLVLSVGVFTDKPGVL